MKILKFYADWCSPCKSLSKIMGEVDIPYEVEEVNIDESVDVVTQYNVRGIPTLILLDDDNNVVKQQAGFISKSDLLNFIQ